MKGKSISSSRNANNKQLACTIENDDERYWSLLFAWSLTHSNRRDIECNRERRGELCSGVSQWVWLLPSFVPPLLFPHFSLSFQISIQHYFTIPSTIQRVLTCFLYFPLRKPSIFTLERVKWSVFRETQLFISFSAFDHSFRSISPFVRVQSRSFQRLLEPGIRQRWATRTRCPSSRRRNPSCSWPQVSEGRLPYS